MRYYLVLLICQFTQFNAHANGVDHVPRVLVVVAHPDDESVFSVTLYKFAKEHNGLVDLAVITNGEAGYKYSVLAEGIYGKKLCNERQSDITSD